MKKKVSRKEIPQQRRQQILDAAKDLFSKKGYHGVTVDAIAEKAGISKGNLYWYFKSKQDIFQLLFDDVLDHLTEPAGGIMESDLSPQEKLRTLTRNHLEAAESNPEEVMLMLQISAQQELNDMTSSGYSQWMEQYVGFLTPLFASLGDKNPELVAMLFATTLDGLMAMVVMSHGDYDKDGVMAVMEEGFISFRGNERC